MNPPVVSVTVIVDNDDDVDDDYDVDNDDDVDDDYDVDNDDDGDDDGVEAGR